MATWLHLRRTTSQHDTPGPRGFASICLPDLHGATPVKLVAIDPDTTLFGWALYDSRMLTATDVAVTPYLPKFEGAVDYVCEIPEDRPGSPARKNDIIKLALAAGQIVGSRPCTFLTPMEWKGQIPKVVHHERMRGVMSPAELRILMDALAKTPKASHPEILDAVALGLTELGRL